MYTDEICKKNPKLSIKYTKWVQEDNFESKLSIEKPQPTLDRELG